MAGRFLFQKLCFRMSRSGEPVTRLASVSAGSIRIHKVVPAAQHYSKVAPSKTRNHGYEGGIRNLHNLFNGASANCSTEAPNLPAFYGHATKYFNTLPGTRAVSKTGSPISGITPAIALKPAFVNSAGVKRTFSSSTSTKDTITSTAEWDAKVAACRAEVTDWFAKKKAEDDAFLRYISIVVGSWCLIFWGFISMSDSGSSHSDTSSCKGKSDPHCQAATSSNPDVKDP